MYYVSPRLVLTYVKQSDYHLPTVTEKTLCFLDKSNTHKATKGMLSQPREIIKKIIDQKPFHMIRYIAMAIRYSSFFFKSRINVEN